MTSKRKPNSHKGGRRWRRGDNTATLRAADKGRLHELRKQLSRTEALAMIEGLQAIEEGRIVPLSALDEK